MNKNNKPLKLNYAIGALRLCPTPCLQSAESVCDECLAQCQEAVKILQHCAGKNLDEILTRLRG
jgi:hypothetical protein